MAVKIIIAGLPLTNQLALAKQLSEKYDVPIKSTDSLIDRNWSEASEQVAHWINEDGPYIIEGSVVFRGLRKFLKLYPEKRMDDISIALLTHTDSLYSTKQLAFAKAQRTIWEQIAMELRDRGVKITKTKISACEVEPVKQSDPPKKRIYRV